MAGGKSAESGAAQNVSLTSTFTFDAVGNLHDATNPAGHKVTYGYDTVTQIYQTSITDNTFGYVSTSTPDYSFGAVASTTDVNQEVEKFGYDEFGRVSTVIAPNDVAAGTPTLSFEYGLGYRQTVFPHWAVTHHLDVQHPGDPLDTGVFIDGLARPIQTKKDAVIDDAGTGQGVVGRSISGHVIYDQRGRIFRQGQPQSEGGAAAATIKQYTKVPMVNQTTFGYDILGRTRGVLTPDAKGNTLDSDGNHVAVTMTDYNFAVLDGVSRLTRQVQDAQGKLRTAFMTVRGDIVGVREQNTLVRGGPLVPLTTRYVPDPLSQLTRVTDQNGNVVTGEYDTLGHLVAVTSPDAGRSEYRYDAQGRLGAKQTANLAAAGKLTRYTYTTDRLATVDFPNSVDVVYTYGASTEAGPAQGNVAGRVKAVTDESGTETRTYDVLGNVAQTVKTPTPLFPTLPKPSYTMSYTYDQFGRVQQMKYPDDEVVSYQYDVGGLVTGATGAGPRGASTYVSALTYDAFGQRRHIAFGNGVTTSYTYDGKTRRLNELKTQLGATVQQDLVYTYDLVGNVNSLANQLAIPAPVAPNTVIAPGPTSYGFAYDDLYQLTGATGKYDGCACGCNNERQYTVATTYDAIGNITQKTQKDVIVWPSGRVDTQAATTYDVKYSYVPGRPHAPTGVGAQALAYDADGNLKTSTGTFGPARTLTWNEEDRVQTEVDRGFTNSYLYDAAGVRTHKRRTSIETVYVNPTYVIRTGTLQTKHVMLGETRVASTMASLTKYGDPSTAGASNIFYYHPDHLQSTNYTPTPRGKSCSTTSTSRRASCGSRSA